MEKIVNLAEIPSKIVGLKEKTINPLKYFHESHLLSHWLEYPGQYKLLYRASEHDFDTGVYHQLCDGIPNLLVLVRT